MSALWREVLPDDAPHNEPASSIARKVRADDGLFFVAEVDSTVVGTVMAGYDGHRGWIYSLAVNPAYQRQGIATALMRQAEKALRNRGCPKVNLQIVSSNSDIAKFYETLGFALEDRVSMGKRLYDS